MNYLVVEINRVLECFFRLMKQINSWIILKKKMTKIYRYGGLNIKKVKEILKRLQNITNKEKILEVL